VVSASSQRGGQMRAREAGGAGDEHFHVDRPRVGLVGTATPACSLSLARPAPSP
jgi:hypothetical protein